MKRLFFLLVILLGLFSNLTAQPTSPKPTSGNDILYIPIEEEFIDCNNDIIKVTGTMIMMFHIPPDGTGGTNIKVRFALQDGEGINLSTGEKLHVIDQQLAILRISNASMYVVVTAVQHLHMITEKTGTSLRVTRLRHLTMQPGGTWEVVTEQVSIKCDDGPTTVRH